MRPELERYAEKLRTLWCESLQFESARDGSLAIATPFLFPDGDAYPVFVHYRDDNGWVLSDHAHGQERAFDDDHRATSARLATIDALAAASGMSILDDALVLGLDHAPEPEDIADFLATLARVVGLREQVPEVVGEEFFTTRVRSRVIEWLPSSDRYVQGWKPQPDVHGDYRADLKLLTAGPGVAAFFVGDTTKSERTAHTALQYRAWGVGEVTVAAVKHSTVGRRSRVMHRLQNALGVEHVFQVHDEAGPNTEYLELRRRLTELGVELSAA